MALAIDATVGGASANAYNTEAELDTAADRVLPAVGWADVASPKRILAAVNATDLLDRMRFAGERVDGTQALEHPRYPIYAKDGRTLVLTTVIDARVKLAHARLTFYLADVADGTDAFQRDSDSGVSSIAFGSELSMTFEKGTTSLSTGERFLRDVIRPILGPLVITPQPTVVRG